MIDRSMWACRAAKVVPLLLAVAVACHEVLEPAPGSGLVHLTAPDTGTADGTSLTPVVAEVDITLPPAQSPVTFTATAGRFVPEGKTTVTVSPESTGLATAYLQAPRDTAVVHVAAWAGAPTGGRVLTYTITFHRALPEAIDVIPDSLCLKPGIERFRTVTAYLRRNFGLPSPFLSVEFQEMSPDSNNSVGQFTTALPSDSSGKVTVRWSVPDTLYYGPVTIRARAALDHNVFGVTRITVKPE